MYTLTARLARNAVPFILLLALFPFAVGAETAGDTVTIEDIAKSLPKGPVNVGFDVDDTVLFTSPAFYYAKFNTDGPDGSNKYGPHPFSNPEFQRDVNRGLDAFSLPLPWGRALIELHKRRGDTILFITARRETPDEGLTELLNRTFGLKNTRKVIFKPAAMKNIPIKENNIILFYGDSDTDMAAAQKAGIRGIRIPRDRLSLNKSPVRFGAFGDDVLLLQ